MGLDMYLRTKSGEEVGYWRKANAIHKWFSNQTENGLDDCEELVVDTDDLRMLKNDCNKVLNILNRKKPTLQPSEPYTTYNENNEFVTVNTAYRYSKEQEEKVRCILPPCQGFFFGGYEINEYYKDDIKNTIKIVDNALATGEQQFIYHAWW